MIVFGKFEELQKTIERSLVDPGKSIIFNLSSYKEGLPPLAVLPNDESMAQMYTQDMVNQKMADDAILNYIFGNDAVFFEFFSKIMYPFYSGLNVLVAVTLEEPFASITESIIKLIQQRYGYNCAYINEAEDLLYLQNSVDATMDINGVYNFDIDKQRYLILMVNSNMQIPITDKDSMNDPLLLY